jgi:hypothetical protein
VGARQATDRRIIEMVVVIVRLQNDVDRRQVVERNPRRHPAPGSRETDRRRALTPHRIDEHVHAADLNQEARMTDPGDEELLGVSAWRLECWRNEREHRGIGIPGSRARRAMHEHPFEETAESRDGLRDPGIAKSAAGPVMR